MLRMPYIHIHIEILPVMADLIGDAFHIFRHDRKPNPGIYVEPVRAGVRRTIRMI